MYRFRDHFFSKIVTLITTLIFMNMSFFLAEVSILELEKDSRFTKIIALILSGTCFEEEREIGGDGSEEQPTAKKIELVFSRLIHSRDGYVLLAEDNKFLSDHRIPMSGNYETFTPPPES